MRMYGIDLAEGTSLSNATIKAGTTYPALPNIGELFYRSDLKALFCHDGTSWIRQYDSTQLGNVNNTSDANKPVSTAQAAAIAAAANVQSDWLAPVGNPASIKNRPELHFYSFLSANQPQSLWYKVAVLPQTTLGTYEQLRLVGVLNDGWAAVGNVPVDITFGNRATDQTGYPTAMKWTAEGKPPSNVRIMGYLQSWGGVEIYVYLNAASYSVAGFTLQGTGNDLGIVPPGSVVGVSQPAGTLVFDTNNVPLNPPQSYTVPAGSIHFPTGISSGDPLAQQDFNMMTGTAQSPTTPAINAMYEQHRVKVTGVSGKAYPGCFSWMTSAVEVSGGVAYKENFRLNLKAMDNNGGVYTPNLMFIQGNGNMSVAGTFQTGSGLYVGTNHPGVWAADPNTSTIYSTNAEIVQFGLSGASAPVACINSYGTGGAGWSIAESVLYLSKGPNANRSINAAGTINTAGTDYAEYMYKAEGCSTVLPGQVIGITAAGEITDKFAASVKFAIKSSDPSFVGGDTWHQGLEKPMLSARVMPVYTTVVDSEAIPATPANGLESNGTAAVDAVTHEELVTAGETDAEWEARQAAHAEAMEAFDVAMEARRQRVDRIAFCGQVPINVLNAVAGQHVVPVADGEGISVRLVGDDDITFAEYRRSIGQVIATYPDGRAKVIVKM